MTFDDILALARAGFTLEQITKLLPISGQGAAPATTPATAPATTPATAPATTPAQSEDMFAKLLAAINGLNDRIVNNNITGANMPPQQTTDDILASIIRPPKKEDK